MRNKQSNLTSIEWGFEVSMDIQFNSYGYFIVISHLAVIYGLFTIPNETYAAFVSNISLGARMTTMVNHSAIIFDLTLRFIYPD